MSAGGGRSGGGDDELRSISLLSLRCGEWQLRNTEVVRLGVALSRRSRDPRARGRRRRSRYVTAETTEVAAATLVEDGRAIGFDGVGHVLKTAAARPTPATKFAGLVA